MTGVVGITLVGSAGAMTPPAAPARAVAPSDSADSIARSRASDPSDAIARDRSRRPADADETPGEEMWRSDVLAVVDGVSVVRPAADVALVGFHEAARAGAAELTPTQFLSEDHGRTVVTTETPARVSDLDAMVLPTRGRSQPATSAIDIAVEADQVVHAPVSGTVLSVQPYLLYGEVPDTRVVIRPTDRPDLRVVVLHVRDVTVAAGDEVEAGKDVMAAGPTPLPFESQVDRFTEARIGHPTPHVHLELRTD